MKKFLSIAAILLLVGAGAAFAQTGGVTGVVADQNGSLVEGARVSLWQEGVCKMHVLTDAAGVFVLTDVAVGTYTLKAGKPKTGQAMVEGVVVVEAQVTDVGTITLVGSGPNGPGTGGKLQYEQQHQYQHGQQE